MQVFGYEVDENYGFVLNCGKLDPIEFKGNREIAYRQAKERQRYEKRKNRRNYTMTYKVKGCV